MQTYITKQVTVENIDAQAILSEFSLIKEMITEFKSQSNSQKECLLTREEVATILKISLPTLNEYTNRGMLKSYRIGTLVRYKESEVMQAPVPIAKSRHVKNR